VSELIERINGFHPVAHLHNANTILRAKKLDCFVNLDDLIMQL